MTSISTHAGIHGPISRSGPGSNSESADNLFNETVGTSLKLLSSSSFNLNLIFSPSSDYE